MKHGEDGGRRTVLPCPHCSSVLRIRSSRLVTATCRELNFICQNVQCGATFGATLEISHQISPSTRPNPAVQLRQAPARPRDPSSGPGVPQPANYDAMKRSIHTG